MSSQVANARYGATTEPVDASSEDNKSAAIAGMEVVMATAKAGVQILSQQLLKQAVRLLVAADINAVPPAGIEGVGLMDDGVPLAAGSGKAVGIGALAVGDIKYQVQHGLFEEMLQAEKPLYIDFRDAFAWARKHVS
jgi:methylene-tetrahydromethanopterin dehydrogenase